MNKRMSHNKKPKALPAKKLSMSETPIFSLYCHMLFDESRLKLRKETLEKEIDEALDQHDRERFLTLSEEYNNVLKAL